MAKRRKIIVMKSGGTTSGSPMRIREACNLIKEKLQEGYFVVPVFSALRRRAEPDGSSINVTDTLLNFRSIIGDGGLDRFIDELWQPHVWLIKELGLISDASFGKAYSRHFVFFQTHNKADWPLIQSIWTEVRRLASKASAYYDEPPSPAGLDALASGGEWLMALIVSHYLNLEWKRSGFPWRARRKTARDIGILTDGNFGDANILQGTRYELIVVKRILACQRQGIVPVVTGFDGVHKETGQSVKQGLELSEAVDFEGVLASIDALVETAFRRPELRARQAKRVSISFLLQNSGKREVKQNWFRERFSTIVNFEEPTNSSEVALKTIHRELSGFPKRTNGLVVRGVQVELSGIQHEVGFTTTLGRGGSDLTATYIAKAVRAEAVYLLKETEGVKTADPELVPTAETILELPYELAVEAGNIQSKPIQPALEDGLRIKVFDPQNPQLFTIIGPFQLQDRLYLLPNSVRARCLTISIPSHWAPEHLLKEILQGIDAIEDFELLEIRYDACGIVLVAKEGRDVEYLERYIQQLGAEFHSQPAHYLRVVGKVTSENTAAFVALIKQSDPILHPIGRPDAKALSAVLPVTVDISDVMKLVHSSLIRPDASV